MRLSVICEQADGAAHLSLLEHAAAPRLVGLLGGLCPRSHRDKRRGDGASLGVDCHPSWRHSNQCRRNVESLRGDIHSRGPDGDERLHTRDLWSERHFI